MQSREISFVFYRKLGSQSTLSVKKYRKSHQNQTQIIAHNFNNNKAVVAIFSTDLFFFQ